MRTILAMLLLTCSAVSQTNKWCNYYGRNTNHRWSGMEIVALGDRRVGNTAEPLKIVASGAAGHGECWFWVGLRAEPRSIPPLWFGVRPIIVDYSRGPKAPWGPRIDWKIPYDLKLVGRRFYIQAFCRNPHVPMGLEFSRGCVITISLR